MKLLKRLIATFAVKPFDASKCRECQFNDPADLDLCDECQADHLRAVYSLGA